MYNKVFLIGRLTKDPVLRMTATGTANTRFTLAVDRIVRKGAEPVTDFLRVVAWSQLAQRCNDFLAKGRLIAVEGRLQISSYEKNGETMQSADIVLDNFQFLERKSAAAPTDSQAMSGAYGQQPTGDVVPF